MNSLVLPIVCSRNDRATSDRRAQLTAGALPAHGIITDVRWRGWEWTFDRLPSGEFDVVVETTAGAQRYRVTSKDRAGRMRVCT